MLRIAVAGATGRIRRPLCQEPIEAGHAVTVVSRRDLLAERSAVR